MRAADAVTLDHGLKIGAQRFTTVLEHSKRAHEHSEEISEQVSARLLRMHMHRPGLILSLSYPRHPERINGKLDEERLFEIRLWSLDEQGQRGWHTHRIRFNPSLIGRLGHMEYERHDPKALQDPLELQGSDDLPHEGLRCAMPMPPCTVVGVRRRWVGCTFFSGTSITS